MHYSRSERDFQMANYNYREEIKKDIREYIEENEGLKGLSDKDEAFEKLNEELWIADSVTGNASGSYTFNRATSEEYVKDNLNLCIDACEEFGVDSKSFGQKVYDEEWEYLDVTIRCYLLGECLSTVLEEYFD